MGCVYILFVYADLYTVPYSDDRDGGARVSVSGRNRLEGGFLVGLGGLTTKLENLGKISTGVWLGD